jgi:hypothetical protein
MDKVIEICEKYNVNIEPFLSDIVCDAMGIGDILLHLVCIKNKLLSIPFYINLSYFTQPYYNMEPINQLEFRIKLIKDVIRYNEIPEEMVVFIFSINSYINESMPYNLIENYNLKFDINETIDIKDAIGYNEYIIFHTKCRHTINENYLFFKEKYKQFCGTHKSKYKIIIMGERIFPHTEEVDIHGITTIYSELLELKKHNDIIDNSIEIIYSNLNYDNYKNDINLIKNAKYNICFGLGGQLCTSVVFGKSTIVYCGFNQILNTINFKKNNFYFDNTDDFFKLIKEKC